MIRWEDFEKYPFERKIKILYEEGNFVVAIRYYGYKVNLYLLGHSYVEVFYNHKKDLIEKIHLLDMHHSRMKFYYDQIKLPQRLTH
jgi:hypothetical protein